MKKLYFASMLLGVVLATTSCEDGNKNYTDDFASIVHFKQEGFVEFDFYNVNKDVTHTITIGKGGHDPKTQPVVTLVPYTEEEMEEYNTSLSTNYKLLPPEYYTMPSEITFVPGESYVNVDIVFKSTAGELAKANNYLLPLHLVTNMGAVYEFKNLIYLKPNVITPSVLLREPANGKIDVILPKEEQTEKNIEVRYYLDLKNEWDFSVNFEKDEARLEQAVEIYNENNETDYTLLPVENREFAASLSFTEAASNPRLPVILNHTGLDLGDYLLPIIPTGCIGMPFNVSKATCYIHVMVTEKLPKIDLKNKATLEASSTVQWAGEEIKNVLDENTETHWQSIWHANGSTDPAVARHDPLYGVYIDITLQEALSKQIAFDYTTRKSDGNAVPNHIKIYAGTNKEDLQQVGELQRAEDGLPTIGDTQYSSKNFSLKGETTLVRLAILSQYNASNKIVSSLTEVNLKSVVISELSLYGK